jgi:hypothetical protein
MQSQESTTEEIERSRRMKRGTDHLREKTPENEVPQRRSRFYQNNEESKQREDYKGRTD